MGVKKIDPLIANQLVYSIQLTERLPHHAMAHNMRCPSPRVPLQRSRQGHLGYLRQEESLLIHELLAEGYRLDAPKTAQILPDKGFCLGDALPQQVSDSDHVVCTTVACLCRHCSLNSLVALAIRDNLVQFVGNKTIHQLVRMYVHRVDNQIARSRAFNNLRKIQNGYALLSK